MKQYKELDIQIIIFQTEDIVTTSPGGIDFKDEDLNWGWEE